MEPERSVSNILCCVSRHCSQHLEIAHLIIIRTVWGSNGDQSPLTSAVLNSASVRDPFATQVQPCHGDAFSKSYHPCPRLQTASTELPYHLRPWVGQVWAEVYSGWVVCHDIPAAAGRVHSFVVEGNRIRRSEDHAGLGGSRSGDCIADGDRRVANRSCQAE
jgi:hypothetical protein